MPRFEIQLLEFDPRPPDDPASTRRTCGGAATTTLRSASTTSRRPPPPGANGVTMLSDEMDYISRNLRLFEGPEGITLELVQWVEPDNTQR